MKFVSASHPSQIRQFFESIWAPFLVGGFIILFLIGSRIILDSWIKAHSESPQPMGPPVEEIQQRVSDVLVAYEVRWKAVSDPAASTIQWQVQIPADLPESDLYVSLQEGLFDMGAEVIRSHHDPKSDQLQLDLGWADSCLFRILFIPVNYKRRAGRIAILIDDFGDRWDTFTQSFLDLDGDITISIIPGLSHSRETANQALAQGREFVIHMPMEPMKGSFPDQGYTLITEMSQDQVKVIFEKSIKHLAGASGVNNHMGSKVTADRRIMGYLMNVMRSEDLYFIDSRTTAASVAYDMALSAGLRCAKRDVFLDTDSNKRSIRSSLLELTKKAEEQGVAIGIGHCYRNTLEVLREEIPKLQTQGFQFVRLSEVVR